MSDLVTLDAVKRYLAIDNSNQDALIAQLIPRESRLIEQWTSRQYPTVTRTAKRFNGHGGQTLVLPDSPILSVSSLTIDGTTIAASSDGILPGYLINDAAIHLIGYSFTRGLQNVVVTWTAGYRASETDTIPSDTTPALTPSEGGTPYAPSSVVNASTGAAFTQVSNSPATTQYSFSGGTFTFAAADAGTEVTMTYDYVPGPVVQGCIELVGLDLKQRSNLGVQSRTLAGESVTYTDRSLPPSVRELLQPYRRVAPA